MAEPQHKHAPHTDFQIMLFMVALCFTCGLLLSVIAYSLSAPQKAAKDFDQNKQMLISAKILTHAGYFQLLTDEGTLSPAQFDLSKKILVAVKEKPPEASEDQIKEISDLRIRPLLTAQDGSVTTFKALNFNLTSYLETHQKTGYADLPHKLFYALLPNDPKSGEITAEQVAKDLTQASLFVLPISGFGLWGAIYGYLAISSDGDTVIGTTWYDQGETPGLGANISEAWWQNQFYNKLIFSRGARWNSGFSNS